MYEETSFFLGPHNSYDLFSLGFTVQCHAVASEVHLCLVASQMS